MAKNNKSFWTPTKIIVTILIATFFFFVLFNTGSLDGIFGNSLSVANNLPVIPSEAIQGGSGGFVS